MNKDRAEIEIVNHQLPLEQLILDIHDVFDAHGVCAAATQTISRELQTLTLIALKSPLGRNIDVWICSPGERVKQTRWQHRHELLDTVQNASTQIIVDPQILAGSPGLDDTMIENSLSFWAIPLPYPAKPTNFRTAGVLCLSNKDETQNLMATDLKILASQLTIFLDRALLRHRSDQQEVEFGIISDIGSSLTSTLNLEEVIHQVTDAVRRVLGAESLTIGLADDSGNEIVFVEALMGPSLKDMPPVRFRIGQGIAGWVAQHGIPAIVNDAYNDRRFSSKVDRDTGFLTHSVLCVPLKIEQRVIGVLEAINKNNGDFDEYDSRLLQAISAPLAIAIENALLHEEALAGKRRIETIFANMSEGLLTGDTEGRITTANEAICQLLGRTQEQVIGNLVSELFVTHPVDFPDFYHQVMNGGEQNAQLACDIVRQGDESVPVLISGAVVEKSEGTVAELIFVFSDLRQVREVERMRDDFFHNIVHELRTPLATILMYARLLKQGKASDDLEKEERFLGVIERESDRLQKMVRQMLLLAKMEAEQPQYSGETADLNAIMDQVLPPLSDRAEEKGLKFQQQVQPNLPLVVGTEDSLYLVFKNLVENALNFTVEGTVSVEAWKSQDTVKIEIADQGIGIPQQALPNLFRRFYRAQTAVEKGIAGTGLGLYMVKEVLEQFGGEIEVTSQEGQGTTFVVSLPTITHSEES